MFYLMFIVFIIGYVFIVLEHTIKVNKAGVALLLGVILWSIYALNGPSILNLGFSNSWQTFLEENTISNLSESMRHFITSHELMHHLGEISSILFFLLGAMTIVELVDKHQGFSIITSRIKSDNISGLIWTISILTFFMSAVLDNLTTTIILLTVMRKLFSRKEIRWVFASLVIIAANAGGAWSPIGDVTTIMLWIAGKITGGAIVGNLLFPSLINVLVTTIIFSRMMKGRRIAPNLEPSETIQFTSRKEQTFMLIIGSAALISVPIFKTFTHLPPFMGMLLGLAVMWIMTDRYLDGKDEKDTRTLTVHAALKSVDISTVLFFLGILLAVGALQSAGHLDQTASWLNIHFHNIYAFNITIGVISAIVDNVPLVAASMGMYDVQPALTTGFMHSFIQDGDFWNLLAYCAGTGGSILIIGSAAGVAAMGIEKINFIWYFKHIAWIAFVGYISGILFYYLQSLIF